METKKSFFQRFSAYPYIVWAALFVIVPLLFVIYYAFTDADGSFTFDNLGRMFDSDTFTVFINSLAFAFISTIICLIIAYPLAYFISRAKKNLQPVLLILFILPMWMNFVLRTYALSVILEDEGIINHILELFGLGHAKLIYTSGSIILGMVYNFLPYMLLPIYTVMSKMDPKLTEASEDLGCNKIETLIRVIFPLSIPGVVSGVTMVFVPSVSTFYISQQLGPTDFTLVGDIIESEIKSTGTSYNYASALSLVLMILILLSMTVMNKFSDDESEGGMLP